MIENNKIQLACRTKLFSLAGPTTGAISLAASAQGGEDNRPAYIRTVGSFLADGFYVGLEVKALGFGVSNHNGPTVITFLTATVMTVAKLLVNEGAAGGRSLSVGLPTKVSWEYIPFSIALITGTPYFDEQYIPGPISRLSTGPNAFLEALPQYIINVYVPSGVGIADVAYTDPMLKLFAPGTFMTLANGDILRVRGNPAPYVTQRRNPSEGWSVAPFTVPLEIRSQNSI